VISVVEFAKHTDDIGRGPDYERSKQEMVRIVAEVKGQAQMEVPEDVIV
jgi:hypothetical protein